MLRPKELLWLSGHQLQDQVVFPVAGYIATALEASKALAGNMEILLIELQDFIIQQAMIFNDDDAEVETLFTLTDITLENELTLLATFTYHSAVGKESDDMTLAVSGKLQIIFGEASNSMLPLRAPQQSNMIEVKTDRFYTSLAQLGYG